MIPPPLSHGRGWIASLNYEFLTLPHRAEDRRGSGEISVPPMVVASIATTDRARRPRCSVRGRSDSACSPRPLWTRAGPNTSTGLTIFRIGARVSSGESELARRGASRSAARRSLPSAVTASRRF